MKKIKIAHFACYGINYGDCITIDRIRQDLSKSNKSIEWVKVDLLDFHAVHNNESYCLKRFKNINDTCDLLLIGGGGLIEGDTANIMGTKWKLPFNEQILNTIKIPIVCFGIGYNQFYGASNLNKKSLDNLKQLIKKSYDFSLRDDGSFELIRDLCKYKNIKEIPDPGMIFEKSCDKKLEIKKGFFQPAWNEKEVININRYLSKDNIGKLCQIIDQNNLPILSHNTKDIYFPTKQKIIDILGLSSRRTFKVSECFKMTDKYREFDFILAMRGHSQIISYGLNIPGIYLSTQPKILGFSQKHELMDYTIDIHDPDWNIKLNEKLDRIKNDAVYLEQWYALREKHIHNGIKKYFKFNQSVVDLINIL